jgi:hypothetical protein
MTKILYTSRSAVISTQRCRRLRWLEYFEGAEGVGLTPARKSSHLVVGGAVHAGMEILLREGQATLDQLAAQPPDSTLEGQLTMLFDLPTEKTGKTGRTLARRIENQAVAAALGELDRAWSEGVELDPEEARQRALAAGGADGSLDFSDLVARPLGGGAGQAAGQGGMQAESPIVVDFADFGMTLQTGPTGQAAATVVPSAPAFQPFDQDAWLKEEMAALVEGMVRCWARRRWRGIHEQFSVLEVEQEGEWTLAQNPCKFCAGGALQFESSFDPAVRLTCSKCGGTGVDWELHFLSRHDALLLERSTGYLYLQSFKTTGSWDRRKELDAQVDMQGLSEAMDVEKRFGEAWRLLQEQRTDHDLPRINNRADAINELVSGRVADWLATLPDPPTILGVRYEYLLKGSRKEDKKAQPGSPRWNQESILCRAYSQEGITSADRRWAWTYEWKDEGGKGRRLDYRSWQKQPVWKAMPIADWIDLLDEGKVQEGALDEDGQPLDALAAQLVPVLVAYRNRDDALDWLEQVEAQEVQVARDVEAVRQAEREGGYAGKRSALNRLFPQTRAACSYPGTCDMRSMPTRPGFCFGPPDAEHDAGVMEHYRTRVANHPKELVQIEESAS